MSEILNRIKNIERRNRKVELDKSWETSLTRRTIIAIVTYFTVVSFFYVANLPSPWINAVVPTMGFLLSTLTVGVVKNYWLQQNNKK